MSFSKSVKQELVRLRVKNAALRRAQLTGITHTIGVLKLGRGAGVEYVTEVHEVGRHIASTAMSLYDVRAEITLREAENRRNRLTVITLTGAAVQAMLVEMGLMHVSDAGVELTNAVPDTLVANFEQKRAFLRGAFLGAGSVNNPKRTYHMEFVCRNEALADYICGILEENDCGAKSTIRKDKVVVYLKEGDRIASCLALIGAPHSTLNFEEARVEKDLRNYINRTNNCETANIGKTVNAAGEQIDAIRRVLNDASLSRRLSRVLKETAELRLNNPDLSLNELAEVAGVGKSGMNHRLQRIIRLAEEI